jgi:hypothetical protein
MRWDGKGALGLTGKTKMGKWEAKEVSERARVLAQIIPISLFTPVKILPA